MRQVRDQLGAREAAALLGVKLPTLYAYVSRGLLRSVPGERGPARRYPRADLERLRAQHEAGSGRAAAAAGALRWGEPVLDSSITRLATGGPAYRGQPALSLAARDAPFEAVAELLWSGSLPTRMPAWSVEGLGVSLTRLRSLMPGRSPVLTGLSLLVPALAANDPGRFDTAPAAVLPRARTLLKRLAAGLALVRDPRRIERALAARSIAHAVSIALNAQGGRGAVRAINRTLILLADHELNASAFAARVAASTGADIYACEAAALATLTGPRHGAASERVEALVTEIGRPEHAERMLQERMRRGERIPGFGHPLYPGGDPRALPIIKAARQLAPRAPGLHTVLALIDAMREAGRPGPNIDAALVALAAALKLPAGSGAGLFAVGRTAGWVAHALEQYEADYVVRPRARYANGPGVGGA